MIDLIVLSERQNHRCAYCGITLTFECPTNLSAATRDHFIPRARGGLNHQENLVAACLHCNTWRGKKDADSFFKKVALLLEAAPVHLQQLEQRLERLCAAQARKPSQKNHRYLRFTRRQIKHVSYYVR